MHGHGIAGALWGRTYRAAMGLLAVICVSLVARIPSAASDVTYDYAGNAFTSRAPAACPSPLTKVSGDLVLANPLPRSTSSLGDIVSLLAEACNFEWAGNSNDWLRGHDRLRRHQWHDRRPRETLAIFARRCDS